MSKWKKNQKVDIIGPLGNFWENFSDKLPVLIGDTDNVVKYLNNEEGSNKKKYLFWDLLINDN